MMQHNGIFTRLSIKIITGMCIAHSQADPGLRGSNPKEDYPKYLSLSRLIHLEDDRNSILIETIFKLATKPVFYCPMSGGPRKFKEPQVLLNLLSMCSIPICLRQR